MAVGDDGRVPRSEPDPALCAVIRELRERRGLAQEAVAQAAGMSLGAYARVELGQSTPSWPTVRAIVNALDVSLAELGRAVEAHERRR